MTRSDIEAGIQRYAPWFYPFDFGAGLKAESATPLAVQPIFETRAQMVRHVVEGHFGARLPHIDCLDVGCHEGYYAVDLAPRVHRVRGLDFRAESVEKARFVAAALGLDNCAFEQADVEDLSRRTHGRYPLTLCLGLLYHLENPMRAIRNLFDVTAELCVIETQVVDEVVGETEWGWHAWRQPYHGILAMIDDTPEHEAGNRQTGSTPIATCPSPRALTFMLTQAGFSRVVFIAPPPGAYEQLARGKRVVCAAYR